MKVTKLHELVNEVTKQVLGGETVLNEDLSNVVDIGKAIIDSDNVDNYVKKLINHIGKVVFTDRVYAGGAPSVLKDAWEYGSILQRVSGEMFEATENESYDLEDGKTYSQDTFYKPKVSAKFFNSKVTFEIPVSFTEKQVKESFSNADQLNGFISMLTVNVENSMTVKLDGLIMRTLTNMIGEVVSNTIVVDGSVDTSVNSPMAVNLKNLYAETYPDDVLAGGLDALITNPKFIAFSVYIMGLYVDRLGKVSKVFNVEKKERFTPKDMLSVVLLTNFSKSASTFLNSATYNKEDVALPTHETVPFWQGSGIDYGIDAVSTIDVKTSSGDLIKLSGVVGIMFDKDAVGVSNLDKRVTSAYNSKAEFYTNFHKVDAGYYNDLGQNFVVFYVA